MSYKLTVKETAFVAALPKCNWVATDAVIQANFKVRDRQGAAEKASRLCKKPQVQEAINRIKEERLQRIGVYAERVLTELARVGLSDIRRLYDEDGRLKHPKDWDSDTAASVAGVEVTEEFEGKGKDKKHVGTTKKVRVFDKVRALESLGKHLGIFPTEKKADSEGILQEFNITNLELSSKLVLWVTLMVKKQKEIEEAKSQPQLNKL